MKLIKFLSFIFFINSIVFMKEMCMKNRYVFAVGVMLLTEICSASSLQLRRSSLSQKKHQSVMERLVSGAKGKKAKGSQVSFGLEQNQVFEITPRKPKLKKGKPGSKFSHDAAPAVLKQYAKAALAALDEAKRPVVQSPCDERMKVRPLRHELWNARNRADAPKKLAAAKKACEDVHGAVKVATITATRLNPVRRTDAFRVSKNRK